MVVEPPTLWKPMLALVSKAGLQAGRAFAPTLQTKINPIWCMVQVSGKPSKPGVSSEEVSLGQDMFLKRLSATFVFEAQVVRDKIERLIKLLQLVNVCSWIGQAMVGLQAHYPIYLTLRKGTARYNEALLGRSS